MPVHAIARIARRTRPSHRNAWRHAVALVLVSSLGACAAVGETSPEPLPVPSLIGTLPAAIDSFDFEGYRHFEDDSGGYSFRYRNERKKRLADVYVYPVAEENSGLEHEALVLGSTRATMTAIQSAVDQGLYANFNVVDTATRSQGLRTVARVQATYLRENLASYTMLYQSEHRGTLMKIRVSMPDNESNRASREWDAFAEQVFGLVIDDVARHEAKSAEPAETTEAKPQPGHLPRAPGHASRNLDTPFQPVGDV